MMELNKINTSHLRRDFGLKPDGVPRAVIDPPEGVDLIAGERVQSMDEPDGRMLVYVATEIGESVLGNA